MTMEGSLILKEKLLSLLSLGENPQLDVLENFFEDFAKELFWENCLFVNNHKILIRDIELSFEGFYSDKIKGHAEQLELGHIFFHKKNTFMSPKMIGVDITAGNGQQHGTIFIREIEDNGKLIQSPNSVFWHIMGILGYEKNHSESVNKEILKKYDGLDLFAESSEIKFLPFKSFGDLILGPKEKMVNKDLPKAYLRAHSTDRKIDIKNIVESPYIPVSSNFKMANTRYKSIIERSFDKDLDAFLFIVVMRNEKYEIMSDFEHFSFPRNKAHIEDRKRIYTIIENEYDNIQTLRDKNKAIEEWMIQNKVIIKKLKNIYKETFSERLSFSDFTLFFKEDEAIEYRKCTYCNLSEKEAEKLFASMKIFTKRKYSRGRSMEIDKIDPNGLYEKNNIALCCYWCNNAKSDEFTSEEFKDVGVVISKIWQRRLK